MLIYQFLYAVFTYINTVITVAVDTLTVAGHQQVQWLPNDKLEELERLRSEDTPAAPHDYPCHWVILDPKSKEDEVTVTNWKNSPKYKIFEFWKEHYTWHTFISCLIRCANMKWIRWVLLKIQSRHNSVHRRTRWYQYTPLSTSLKRGGGGGGGLV